METVLRVAIVYVFLLFGLRIIGKREFAQLTPLELVTLMLIPELVSQALIREDFSLTNGLVGVATLLSLTYLTSVLQHHSKRFATALTGQPAVLVAHGRFVEEAMNAERMQPDEVLAEMHRAGLERLDEVRWALLESDGRIAIIPASGPSAGAATDQEQPTSEPDPVL